MVVIMFSVTRKYKILKLLILATGAEHAHDNLSAIFQSVLA